MPDRMLVKSKAALMFPPKETIVIESKIKPVTMRATPASTMPVLNFVYQKNNEGRRNL